MVRTCFKYPMDVQLHLIGHLQSNKVKKGYAII